MQTRLLTVETAMLLGTGSVAAQDVFYDVFHLALLCQY